MCVENSQQLSGTYLSSKSNEAEPCRPRAVGVWCDEHVRYPDKQADAAHQEHLRSQIRKAADSLACSTRQYPARHAIYMGQLSDKADIENALLYNIRELWSSVKFCEPILRFEGVTSSEDVKEAFSDLGERDNAAAYCRIYSKAKEEQGFFLWRKMKSIKLRGPDDAPPYRFVDIEPRMLKDAATVWYEVRKQLGSSEGQLDSHKPFGISVTLHASRENFCHAKIKPLLDGIIASLHCQSDRDENLNVITGRLLDRLKKHGGDEFNGDEVDLRKLILGYGEDGAVLGDDGKTFRLRGAGVQISPRDDLCMAAEIKLESHSLDTVSMDIEVFEVGLDIGLDSLFLGEPVIVE